MENFLFLEKVEDYKKIQLETKKYEAVQIIVEEFMTEDSLFELNLNQEIIQKVLTKMEEKPIADDIFDTSRISIEFLMNDTLMRFSKQRKEDAAKKEALLKNQEERRGSVVNLLGTFIGKKNKEHILMDNAKRRPSVQVFTKFSLGKTKEVSPNTSPEMSPKSTGSTSPNYPSSPTSFSLVKSKKQARGMNSLNFVIPQKLSNFEIKNLDEPEPQELKELKQRESNVDRNSFSEIVDDLQFDELEKKLEFSGMKHKRRGGIAEFGNPLKESVPVEVQTQSYLSLIREHDGSQKTNEGRPKREKSKKRGIFENFKVDNNFILTERSSSVDSLTTSSPLKKKELFGIVSDMKKRNQSMTDLQSSPKKKNYILGDVHPKKFKEEKIASPEYVTSPQTDPTNLESSSALKEMMDSPTSLKEKTMESPSFEIMGNESPISVEDRSPSTDRSLRWNSLKGFIDNPFDLKRKSSGKDVLPPRDSPNLLKNTLQKSKKKLTDLRENQRRSSVFAKFQRKNSSTEESLDFISMITSRGKEKKSEDLDFMSMISAREPEPKPNNDPLNFLGIISARGKKKNEEPKDNEPVSGFLSILSARGKKKKEQPKEDLDFMSMISSRGKNPDKQPVEKPAEMDVNPFHKLYEEKKKEEENPFHKLYEEKMKEKVKEELVDENPFNRLYQEKNKEESKVVDDQNPFNKLYEEKKKEKLKDENPFNKLYEEKKKDNHVEVKNPTNVGSVLYPSNEKTVQESNLDLILKRAKQAKESVPKTDRRGTPQHEVPFNPTFSMETVVETPPIPLESKKNRRGKSEYTVEVNESFSMEEKVDLVKSPPNVKKNRRGNSQYEVEVNSNFSLESSEEPKEEIKPLREPKKNRRGIMENVVVVENFKMESNVVPLTPREQEEKECFEIMVDLGLETEKETTPEPIPEVSIVKNGRKKSRREGNSEFVGFESNFSME
jgi:hypothetical protein